MSERIQVSNKHEHTRASHAEQINQQQHPEKQTIHVHEREHQSVESRLRHARHEVESHAEKRHTIDTHSESDRAPEHHYITRRMRHEAYRNILADTQQSLPPLQRSFSRFIHNDVVYKLSEIGAKTVARPAGLVGGGLVGLAGGMVLYFTARWFGFALPVSVTLILFACGYVIGCLFELVFRDRRHSSKREL